MRTSSSNQKMERKGQACQWVTAVQTKERDQLGVNHRIKRDPNEFFTFYRDDEVITETQTLR